MMKSKFDTLFESVVNEIRYSLVKPNENRFKNSTEVYSDGKYLYKMVKDTGVISTGFEIPEDAETDKTKHPDNLKDKFAEKYDLVLNYRIW